MTLIEDSQNLNTRAPTQYDRPAVSADGGVVAINRSLICVQRGLCDGLQLRSTTIYSSARTLSFPGRTDLTANGRFALIYFQPIGVQLADLASGQVTLVGSSENGTNFLIASVGGHFVAEDGTVLLGVDQGVKLVGPSGSGVLHLMGSPFRALLAGDASRIIYETVKTATELTAPSSAVRDPTEIHSLDVKTGLDRSFGPGQLIALAGDGRRFSYLRTEGDSTVPWFADTQVWVGDAIDGGIRRLTNEPEGISEQTIAGDGRNVIAATRTGRLLNISTTTGEVRQLLDSPGPQVLFTAPVPGSYNEIVGNFSNGPPELLIGTTPAVILGPSLRGYAVQIPWEVPPARALILRGNEPAWERQLAVGVQDLFPMALPVGPTGRNPPSGGLGAYSNKAAFVYAIHEDWSGVVNTANPATPGEIVHIFGSGWGQIDGIVPTGQPTPSDRPYRITLPCEWRATGASRQILDVGTVVEVSFAGLAPGLTGIYQLDIRIPFDWMEPGFDAFCIVQSGQSTLWAETALIEVLPAR